MPKERLIEFTPEIRKNLVDTFTQQQKHAPTGAEIKRLTDDWLLNEIVYREALVQGFDKGDEMIRDRINAEDAPADRSPATSRPIRPSMEADLQKWLECAPGPV